MSLPYFRYFLGDHLKAKVGMTHQQKGIYTELLEISWEQTPPGTLPNDPAEIARLLGVPLKRFTPQVPIVLRAWKRQGKRLVHGWLQQEHGEKFAKHSERSEAGKKGNAKRWHGSLSDRSAIAKGSHSESESDSESEPSSDLKSNSKDTDLRNSKQLRDDEFLEFWKAYPKKVGKKAAREAWKNAKDRPALDKILDAIAKAKGWNDWTKEKGRYIPHPATWLNKGRWDDEVFVPPKPIRRVSI